MIIAVLDYNVGEIFIGDVPKDMEELDGDDICEAMGFKASQTEYMIVEDGLPIRINTKYCSSRTILK